MNAPFSVLGAVQDCGSIWLTLDRKQHTGEPIKVVRLEVAAGCRYGHTETG